MGTKRYPKYIAEASGGLDARGFGNTRAKGYTKLEWPPMVKNEGATHTPPYDTHANDKPKKKKKK